MRTASEPSAARYDQAYFDKWYRDPKHRVTTRTVLTRKVMMVVGITEYFLGRPIRTVLDVGCGEGLWEPVLRGIRPKVRYQGIDASAYAIGRFGARRNLMLGTFEDLPYLELDDGYDLVVCSDMLYYVSNAGIARGFASLAPRIQGVAFLEAYASGEPVEGDTRTWIKRTTAYYRKMFAKNGLVQCGPHCWLRPDVHPGATNLELVQGSGR